MSDAMSHISRGQYFLKADMGNRFCRQCKRMTRHAPAQGFWYCTECDSENL